MSGAAARGGGSGDGYGSLYHRDEQLITAFDHDGGGFFFQQTVSPRAGDGDGGTAPYASIADYLQGFLDPAGLAAHFGSDDAPPPPPPSCRLGGGADHDAVVVKQETAVQLSGSHRDDDVDGQLAGAAPVTPANSSVLSSSSCEAGAGADDEEEPPPRRRCGKKGRIEGEEEQQEGEVEADDYAADRNCK